MSESTCWGRELSEALKEHDDTLVASTLSEEEAKRLFDPGFGGREGAAFTAWGEKRVYFPLCYDGAEWIGSAPRNPCDEALEHQGG